MGKKFCLKLAAQGLLQLYSIESNSDPINSVNDIHATFNIDGTTIHFALYTPIVI
jgi:hypothetical protein